MPFRRKSASRAVWILALLAPGLARSESLDLKRPDHQTHIAAAYGLTLSGALLLRKAEVPYAPIVSGASVVVLGILKEALMDDRYLAADVQANLLGTALGVGFCYAFEF